MIDPGLLSDDALGDAIHAQGILAIVEKEDTNYYLALLDERERRNG